MRKLIVLGAMLLLAVGLPSVSKAQSTGTFDLETSVCNLQGSGYYFCSDIPVLQDNINNVSINFHADSNGNLTCVPGSFCSNITFLYDVTSSNPYGITVNEAITGTYLSNGPGSSTLTASFSGPFTGTVTFTLTPHKYCGRFCVVRYVQTNGVLTLTGVPQP